MFELQNQQIKLSLEWIELIWRKQESLTFEMNKIKTITFSVLFSLYFSRALQNYEKAIRIRII